MKMTVFNRNIEKFQDWKIAKWQYWKITR